MVFIWNLTESLYISTKSVLLHNSRNLFPYSLFSETNLMTARKLVCWYCCLSCWPMLFQNLTCTPFTCICPLSFWQVDCKLFRGGAFFFVWCLTALTTMGALVHGWLLTATLAQMVIRGRIFLTLPRECACVCVCACAWRGFTEFKKLYSCLVLVVQTLTQP